MSDPYRSAADDLGPHLLGRVYRADGRDWSVSKLLEIADPPASTLERTVEQMLSTPYFTDWKSYLVFWRWLKQQHRPPSEGDAWQLDIQLDQGNTGHCVGFGWAGWVNATPEPGNYQNPDGHALYYECKVIDWEPREENGSTVRSGALAARARGRLAAFGFAKTTADIDEWIDHQGTVVVGTTWTNDMFRPDDQGFVRPTGSVAGGHCYLMLDRIDDAYLFQNSWGGDWGQSGRFKMRRSDFADLLADWGECCCSVELPARVAS